MSLEIDLLTAFGVNGRDHVQGELSKHLLATATLLESWGNAHFVCISGLLHAAYGTGGFEEAFLSLADRERLRARVGEQAEALIYFYCACDRAYTYPRIVRGSELPYRDRFTGLVSTPSDFQFRPFCELTLANELEIAGRVNEHWVVHGSGLTRLFSAPNFQRLTSAAGQAYLAAFLQRSDVQTMTQTSK